MELQKKRISKAVVSEALGISLNALYMLCKKSEVLQKEIDDILETPLEFAHRDVLVVINSFLLKCNRIVN